MSNDILLDNDIILKVCCFDFVAEVIECLQKGREVWVLGTARFVLNSRIKRSISIRNKDSAIKSLANLIAQTRTVEPDDSEVAFAAEFESRATANNLILDGGESLLLAVLLGRSAELMLTGDKRAISAIEAITPAITNQATPTGKLGSLEQLFLHLLSKIDVLQMHQKICREPSADLSLTNCFSCNSGQVSLDDAILGLMSYIRALRLQAPTVLVASEDLSSVIF
jgi:hypothetical protein